MMTGAGLMSRTISVVDRNVDYSQQSNFMSKKCQDSQGQSFQIRDATVSDAAEWMEYVCSIAAERDRVLAFADEWPEALEQQEQMLGAILEDPSSFVALACMDGEIIGVVELTGNRLRRTAHVANIGMSVHSQHRRRGVGQQLLEYGLVRAQKMRLRKIKLSVFSQNRAAIALYQKAGFRNVGRWVDELLLNDGSYDDLIQMERRV